MEETAQQKHSRAKSPRAWMVAAESFLHSKAGSDDRLSTLDEDGQASAMLFLVRELSKSKPLSQRDAVTLRQLLSRPPRQFDLIIGAALLGGGDDVEAKHRVSAAGAALAHEKLSDLLGPGVPLEKRMSVLELLVRAPLRDEAKYAVLAIVASWLEPQSKAMPWPRTPLELRRLNEILTQYFPVALTTDGAESFWRAYTKHVPVESLQDSPLWSDLVIDSASRRAAGTLSDEVRAIIASYLEALGAPERTRSKQEAPTRVRQVATNVSNRRESVESPAAPTPALSEPTEDRPGYLTRIRAARIGIEKLVALLDEAEHEHKLFQASKTENDRSRRKIDSFAKREADLVREKESLGEKVDKLEARVKEAEAQRVHLEDSIQQARREVARLKDLLFERDAENTRLAARVEQIGVTLSDSEGERDQLREERDSIAQEAARLRLDRDRIASEHDDNINAERRLSTERVLAELRSRIGNMISLQWDAAYRLAATPDERESLEGLKRRLLDITKGF